MQYTKKVTQHSSRRVLIQTSSTFKPARTLYAIHSFTAFTHVNFLANSILFTFQILFINVQLTLTSLACIMTISPKLNHTHRSMTNFQMTMIPLMHFTNQFTKPISSKFYPYRNIMPCYLQSLGKSNRQLL